ncbi:UNVERIFIED_CONTAM: hypothetical protein HDU68_012885, partial [Siphonaria sp. JEL0065]
MSFSSNNNAFDSSENDAFLEQLGESFQQNGNGSIHCGPPQLQNLRIPSIAFECFSGNNDSNDSIMTPVSAIDPLGLAVPSIYSLAASPYMSINPITMMDDFDLLLSPNPSPFLGVDNMLNSPFAGSVTPHMPNSPLFDMMFSPMIGGESMMALSPAIDMSFGYADALNDAAFSSNPFLDSLLSSNAATGANSTAVTTPAPSSNVDDLYLAGMDNADLLSFGADTTHILSPDSATPSFEHSIDSESLPSSFCSSFPSSSNASSSSSSVSVSPLAPKMEKNGQHLCHYKGCYRSFSSAASLKQHYLTHTGAKPFQCSKCEK